MNPTVIRGITWDHPRGHAPLVATAETFLHRRPDVEVHWTARSLEDFAHYPVDRLAAEYDLTVFDHPSCGVVAQTRCFIPLEDVLDESVLDRCAGSAIGESHRSYTWEGQQLGIAIDAACHVASYRPDLISHADLPSTWDDVLALAADGVPFALPLFPTDCYCAFTSLAAHLGDDPFANDGELDAEVAATVLAMMRRLAAQAHPSSEESNPIAILDLMSSTDEIAFCPLLFGYSNYAKTELPSEHRRVRTAADVRWRRARSNDPWRRRDRSLRARGWKDTRRDRRVP